MCRKLISMLFLLFFFISVKAWPLDRIRISYSAISGSQAVLRGTKIPVLWRSSMANKSFIAEVVHVR